MSWICPTCGSQHSEITEKCMCGYYVDESVFFVKMKESEMTEAAKEAEQILKTSPQGMYKTKLLSRLRSEEIKAKFPEKTAHPLSNKDAEEIFIKKIDSWVFSFSKRDQCVCLGTPALQSFSLKLTLNDLEDLLETVYQKTGKEKKSTKISLSDQQIHDLIDRLVRMIEEKRSKVSLEFTGDELHKIADFINMKLMK